VRCFCFYTVILEGDIYDLEKVYDRVLHHAHVVNITGKSYRLKKYTDQEEE
jgi:DNA replication protein DnaC